MADGTPQLRLPADFFKKAAGVVVTGGVLLFVLVFLGFLIAGQFTVGKGMLAVQIRKTGEDLPSGEIIATKESQKGIQLNTLTEGWYWRNPYTWDVELIEQTTIDAGQVGVQIRTFGEPMGPGQVIARENQRGVQAKTLGPGRYAINSYAYKIEKYAAVEVPSGHLGVVIQQSGKDPVNPNDFLVEAGERGTQKHTVPPGTYYPNPFIERIVPVDVRSHRFDMAGEMAIHFPSLDGFDIQMDGTIEWKIDPQRLPEVYVRYVDKRDVITCITDEIILPNARAFSRIEGSKHLARDFISGITREKFQEQFRSGMQKACAVLGIQIQSALVRDTVPPPAIAKPIKDREIAIRLREMYTQEGERERQQKLLSMEEKMKERKTQVKQVEADVAVAVTGANQEKDVAIIEANRVLEVAKLQLEAAQNQGAAKIAEGKAKADVIVFKNAAEAAGLKNAATAFGDGETYVKYVTNLKLAPAIQYVLSNTDGPFMDLFKRLTEPAKKEGK
jgi:regulator of protease activity HflC (stomatin/prohibitin superfamily)